MGRKQAPAPRFSPERLAAIAGSVPAGDPMIETPQRVAPALLQPDLSRIRPRGIEETPEQRKKRLAAKTINFTFTILARFLIMGALGLLILEGYQRTGRIERGPAVAICMIFADLGRVIMKAMEPGTK